MMCSANPYRAFAKLQVKLDRKIQKIVEISTNMCYNEKNLECIGRMIEEKADWKTGYQEALGYLGGII